MIAAKKFFIGLLAAIILNVAAAHAEEVDPYFAWEIKNLDDYQRHDFVFKNMYSGGIIGLRDFYYKIINSGGYYDLAKVLEVISVYQKTAFGADYFDAGLTELNAKLYLQADELDAAERKINLLSENAADNPTKIRALILKADLLNRREKFADALQAAQEVDELLKTTPDEKLSLLTALHVARAYCGLGDTKSAIKIFNRFYKQIESTFGEHSTVTFSMMSLGAELAHKTGHDDTAKDWLLNKGSLAYEIYEQNDHSFAAAGSRLELATFYFETGDTEKGTEVLNNALGFTEELYGEQGGAVAARRFYKKINAIATKYLGKNHKITLLSEYNSVYINANIFGDIPQAITFYEQNLPKFKKFFGEEYVDTLDMMKGLKDSYLALGRYADAKRVAEEKLRICQKHFGDNGSRTIYSTIQLAEIYYRMGKYKTADKLLADLQAQNSELFEKIPPTDFFYNAMLETAAGARMKGDLSTYSEILRTMDKLLEKHNPQYKENFLLSSYGLRMLLETSKFNSMTGLVHNTGTVEYIISNLMNIMGANYNAQNLGLIIDIADLHVRYGDLTEAARYANQVLKLSRSHLGGNNLIEWTALNTLSKIRRAEGNFTDALDLDKQALQIAETVCGKNSLERLQSLDAMASDLAADNLAEAIKIRERALTEYKKILEDTDAATVQMMTNLAENYVTAGRYADAIKLCDETLAVQKIPIYTNNHLNFYPSVTELIRIKAKAQKLSGDNVNAYMNYANLIQAYEAQRTANSYINSGMSGEENKSKWFASNVPVYKDAADLAVAVNVNDKNFAFFFTELCKGRSLIDRFDDVLGSKSYLLTAAEKKELAEHENMLQVVQTLGEQAEATNDEALALNVAMVYTNLKILAESFKSDLREKYSVNMVLKNEAAYKAKNMNFGLWDQMDPNVWEQPSIWDWNEILKNFDVQKNSAAIPNGACLIEFLKASDNSLVVTFLSNDGEVQAANISVDEKFFDDCKLYHDLISYPDINSMSEFGKKYLWQIGDEYKITDIREKTVADENSVKDDSKFIGLRQKLCAELSEKLLPTLEKFAGKFSYWIISPDAELNLVPFETLTYRGKFLVDEKNVSYVPSLAVMNLMRNRERKNSYLGRNKELFAMGDAIYGDNDETATRGSFDENFNLAGLKWSNLPGAARELDKISALFESKNIFRREQATEKNLRQLNSSGELSQYKYLLFSAHGIFVPQRPELSSIVLSQNFDAEFDGYVTVGEWMSYDLRSDLIYLSACESGRGSYQAGEGIVGIPYALTVAGNKDTVMSLWKVNDAATAEFTSAVFEKLSRGKSEVDAINETKREFLSNPIYRDPSIWAAFVLYGI